LGDLSRFLSGVRLTLREADRFLFGVGLLVRDRERLPLRLREPLRDLRLRSLLRLRLLLRERERLRERYLPLPPPNDLPGRPFAISTITLIPIIERPFKSQTASSASRVSENSTKQYPRFISISRIRPYPRKNLSMSRSLASYGMWPT